MTAALLSVEALCVSLGEIPVLDGLSFQVGGGEIVGLVGASGSGKSVTALAIMRLLPREARWHGIVRLKGASLSAMTEGDIRAVRGRDIGMIFQDPTAALNPLMRVGAQVAETVRLHGAASRAGARAMARSALTAVGLEDARERYPHELSGGQRQRVAIAMAVVLRPALLIADEPTTALDVSTQAEVLALLQDLVREHRMGLILVSHDLAVIAQLAHRIVVLHDGAAVDECIVAREAGTRRPVLRFSHPVARALLAGSDLTPKATVRGLPATRGPPALEVRGLVREYPGPRRSLWHAPVKFRAVNDVSLAVHAGETVGLVGESGAGKSSLVRAILALEPIQRGEVRLLGEPFSASARTLRRLRRSIQAVFQDSYGSFDPQWSVERLIAEPFYLLDTPPTAAERRRRVLAVLEQVGLSSRDLGRHPREFSGGQRQRIAIARALITEPKVIAFDEAVSALDVLVRAQILALLEELSGRLKLAYLFVSHDLNVIRAIADRVYVMQQGRIVEHGPTPAVFASPQHPYTQALLAATPRLGSAS